MFKKIFHIVLTISKLFYDTYGLLTLVIVEPFLVFNDANANANANEAN